MVSPNDIRGSEGCEAFRRDYWQRCPLLQKAVLPEPPVSLTAEAIAEMATDPELSSQIVMGDTATRDWMTIEGPVTETFFSDTPEQDWQVTVWAVEQQIPAFGRLREAMGYVPEWRFDGISATYAAPGGTAGPVSDDADSFLLQVSGTKDWAIGWHTQPATDGAEGSVGAHQSMQARLEPGDLLYLPPGATSCGVATTDSVSYRIRFRAPTPGELFLAWAQDVAAELDTDAAARAPDEARRPGDVSQVTLSGLRNSLRAAEGYSDRAVNDWLAHYLTRPALPIAPLLSDTEPTREAIEAALQIERELVVNGAVRLALVGFPDGVNRLFIDGREEVIGRQTQCLAEALSARRRITRRDLGETAEARAEQVDWLARGLRSGWLLFDDELQG